MTVRYEWDVEECAAKDSEDYEEGEIMEHWFQESYAGVVKQLTEAPAEGFRWDSVLVCDDGESRSWAYMVDGKLPTHFEDAYQHPTRKVPQRFHDEVAKAS